MDLPPASSASGSQAVPWEDSPGDLPAERIALGTAVFNRADEIARLVDGRFPDRLAGKAYSTARLATELIGRWLATDRAASVEEETVLARQGEQAIVEDADLADVTKAYFAWRDTTIAVIEEEAQRLGVSDELLALIRSIVRLSSDGSLVRILREFDATRRRLQQQLREEQERLAYQALHDELTGLPNRSLFTDRLRQSARAAERRQSRSMLLYLDLDDFKEINDRYGHRAGDAMLVAVASRLTELVRSADTVARLGGDEFVVLAEELDHPDAAARSLAKRIRLAMQEPVAVGDRQLQTSVSIGIAPVLPGSDPEVFLSRADMAMYEAKRLGPDRHVVFSEALGAENSRRSLLVDELHLAHRSDQFTIHYQPMFEPTGALVGVEALLRWQHPELGSVAPDEFVPLLEQSRDIVAVGRWVLAAAAAQCQRWRRGGWPGLSLSVNVSRRQLQDQEFLDDVREALDGLRARGRLTGPRALRVGPHGGHGRHRRGHGKGSGPRGPSRPRQFRAGRLLSPSPA